MRPELVMRALLPVVMAGIIGIYGLIVDMVLLGYCTPAPLHTYFVFYSPAGLSDLHVISPAYRCV